MKMNVKPKGTKVENKEGGESFRMSPETRLLNLTSTCLFKEPKFYGEVESDILETCEKVAKKNPKYLLQLANYLRNEMYLRTISTVLYVKAANLVDCKPYVKDYAPFILKRADELNEAIACQLEMFGKPIPNSLKKGIANTFKSFDEYQFGKYNRDSAVKFKDTIMLTHPKEPSEIIKKILSGELKTPYTWETELSEKGNKPEVWEALIDSKKLPYMATLRNLRNILTTGGKGVSDSRIDKVINYIKDEKSVKRSKQFPFRFFSAYRELEGINNPRTSDLLDALEEAIYIAYENIPYMKGTTLLASDVSGSMDGPVSRHSKIRHIDIGIILSSATHKYTDKSITGCFGTDWKTYSMSKKSAGIMANVKTCIRNAQEVGWSTNGWKVIDWLNTTGTKVDRVLIFTDMEMYDSSGWFGRDTSRTINKEWQKYKKNINPDAKVYMLNLNGYGDINFPEGDKSVVQINGWSDKVLRFIEDNERDQNKQVKYIMENY